MILIIAALLFVLAPRFTVNIGFTFEGLKALGLSQKSLDSFPEAFRVVTRGRANAVT